MKPKDPRIEPALADLFYRHGEGLGAQALGMCWALVALERRRDKFSAMRGYELYGGMFAEARAEIGQEVADLLKACGVDFDEVMTIARMGEVEGDAQKGVPPRPGRPLQ